MTAIALFVHLLAVVFWVGGMAFAHFALRPALAETLAPPQRLPLLVAALRRFLRAVTWAIVALVASGGVLLAGMPNRAALPSGVRTMIGLGVLMILVFVYLRLRPYPALMRAVAAVAWPEAGAAAAKVRHLVGVNLVLGILAIAAVVLWR